MAEENLQKVQQPTLSDVQKSVEGISNLFATVNQMPSQSNNIVNNSSTGTSGTSSSTTSSPKG